MLVLGSHAQEVRDFGLWGTISYGGDINDDIDFSIEQEVRMEQNATTPGVIFTSLGLDYRLNREFQVGLNYRFILNDRDLDIYGHRHRVMLDLQYRKLVRQWTFGYRSRSQSEIRTRNYANEYGFSPTLDLRNTFKTVYQLNRRFELYASFDLRVLWSDPRTPDFRGIDRFRYRLGTDVLIAREQSIGIFLQHQREINISNPEVEFMIGLEYKFGSRRQLMES
ncbi:MAG TPA: DUF2490 domain-containing protein [Cryomorphaceae bacterium]|nr:DUF2490 domain-containing protein [Cryomorphaceae bacterium]